MAYTNSSLISLTKISPNRNAPRNHKIDTISIHCYVGQASIESAANYFAKTSTQASCNYYIGTDGRIALIVPESDRSWCTSSPDNDNRAITIECASDKIHPYKVNDKVFNTLIDLLADICKRNDIKELKWQGDKNLIGQIDKQNMTVHRWFKAKACPGQYLYDRHGEIARQVNEKLNPPKKTTTTTTTSNNSSTAVPFSIKINGVSKGDVLNIRKEPNSNSAKTGQLAYNDSNSYTIVEVKNGWGKLKSGIGWINLSYTKTVSKSTTTTTATTTTTTSSKPQAQWFGLVNASSLNVRSNAGTNYGVSFTLKKNTEVLVYSSKTGTDGAKWFYISYNGKFGYVHSNYITKMSLVSGGYDYSHVFNPVYYVEKYPDLMKAFGYNGKKLFNHFLTHGMKEGRKAIPSFDVNVYKKNNGDLQKAYGTNLVKYYQHYIRIGRTEGRKVV